MLSEKLHKNYDIAKKNKEIYLKQRAKVIWITGLSGSGKTTLSKLIEKRLSERNYFCQILDGDYIRAGLNKDLSFSESDRMENIRRVAEVSKIFVNSGIIVICAFISPTKKMRAVAENIIGKDNYLEVYVDTPIEICEQRDSKGLYRKARNGEITNFTGVSSPFEAPENPFLQISNINENIDKTINEILLKILPKIELHC